MTTFSLKMIVLVVFLKTQETEKPRWPVYEVPGFRSAVQRICPLLLEGDGDGDTQVLEVLK